MRSIKFPIVIVLLSVLLSACVSTVPQSTATPPAQFTAPPAPTQPTPTAAPCESGYTRHAIPGGRETYSQAEFEDLLRGFGVEQWCIPLGAGAPYLLSEWSPESGNAQAGRMLMIGFENWPAGMLVYATYDLVIGSVYDVYATSDDYAAMQNASLPGFERIYAGPCFGTCVLARTYILPFAGSYLALVLPLGAYEAGAPLDQAMLRFAAGEFPAELQADVEYFNVLSESITVEGK